jgi:hypothetical protein
MMAREAMIESLARAMHIDNSPAFDECDDWFQTIMRQKAERVLAILPELAEIIGVHR